MYSTSSLTGLVSSKRRLHWPPYLRGEAEIEANRLGMADVQIAVGLRREARLDPAGPFVGAEVVLDDGFEEVERAGWLGGFFGGHGSYLGNRIPNNSIWRAGGVSPPRNFAIARRSLIGGLTPPARLLPRRSTQAVDKVDLSHIRSFRALFLPSEVFAWNRIRSTMFR